MLKKIPYSDSLISIGNANHYNGEPVYSDGRVAYGWVYNGGYNPPVIPKKAGGGYWVGEEDISFGYKLANKNLLLSDYTYSGLHGDLQAYPCWVEEDNYTLPYQGRFHKAQGGYHYTGVLISMDGTGKALVYDNYALMFYNNEGKFVLIDLSALRNDSVYPTGIFAKDAFSNLSYVIGEHEYEYVRKVFQLAKTNEARLTANVPKRDQYGNVMYSGSYTITYTDIGGTSTVTGNGYVVDDTMCKFAYDANGNLIARSLAEIVVKPSSSSNVILAQTTSDGEIEVSDSNGNQIYAGPGVIDTTSTTTGLISYDIHVPWATGYGRGENKIAGGNYTIETYGSHILVDGGTVYNGPGNLWGYTVAVDWSSGTADRIETEQGVTKLYDNNNILLVEYESGTVKVYNDMGSIIYDGAGTVSLSGLSYTIDCAWMHPTGTFYAVMYRGAVAVLEYDGTNIVVRDDSGNTLYSGAYSSVNYSDGEYTVDCSWFYGYGWATVLDKSHIEYQGTTLVGTISITQSAIAYEDKQYLINASGVTEQAYPQTLQLNNSVSLNLSNMALVIGQQTYGNDPLGLYNVQYDFVYPGGVHADKDYIISQAGQLIWHATTVNGVTTIDTQTYYGISKCFALNWIKKWVI